MPHILTGAAMLEGICLIADASEISIPDSDLLRVTDLTPLLSNTHTFKTFFLLNSKATHKSPGASVMCQEKGIQFIKRNRHIYNNKKEMACHHGRPHATYRSRRASTSRPDDYKRVSIIGELLLDRTCSSMT
jgi:hypothetical protein